MHSSLASSGYVTTRMVPCSSGLKCERKGTDSGSSVTDSRSIPSHASEEYLAQRSDQILSHATFSYVLFGRAETWIKTSCLFLDDRTRTIRQPADSLGRHLNMPSNVRLQPR